MLALILAETFVKRYDDQLAAVAIMAIAIVLVVAVNRWMANRGRRLVEAISGGGLSQGADTRLRFVRRMIDTTIIVIALALALSHFTALGQVGRTILTSGAIAAAVIGFAARQVLANAIAGVLLAITQPLRIGDFVTFEGETGTVEEIKIASTWLRSPSDARIVIPNERLAAGVLKNDSIVTPDVALEVSIWLARDDDAVAAVDALRKALDADVEVRIAETTAEGVRLLLLGSAGPPRTLAAREAALREQGLRAIGRNPG